MPAQRWIAGLALALATSLGALAAAGQPPPANTRGAADDSEEPVDERLSAEITVFEAQLTLDPRDLSFRDRQRLRPEQILLLEAGAPRRVTNLQPLEAGAWRILIYFDAPLSRERTIRLAALRLGGEAQRLTDLGTVEVIVADPEPRVAFAASREPMLLAEALERIGDSGIGSDEIHAMRLEFGKLEPSPAPADPRRFEALRRELELVRARVDPILLHAAEGCDGAPCLLVLVSDGFYEEPAAFYLGEGRLADPQEARPALEASRELAQTVAGYEWIAYPLPLRENRLETPTLAKPRSDFEVFLDHTGAVRRLPKAEDREPDISLEALEISVTPILQPLQRLAVDSAGGVVRVVDDLANALSGLADRRRIFYLTDRPLDGEPRPVQARLVESATALRTPAWVRSSTPAAVAGARVRALLSGRPVPGGVVPLRAALERDGDGQATLVLEAEWGADADLLPRSLVRVSVGYQRPGDLPWVGHQRLTPGEVGDNGIWRHRLALSLPPGVERLAVVTEALVPRAWGAALVAP